MTSPKGHELGHWELHVDQSTLGQPRLFPNLVASQAFFRCQATKGPLWVARTTTLFDETSSASIDDPKMAREVNRYAAALLMPRDWLIPAVRRYPEITPRTIVELAEHFGVSKSAMRVRLNEVGIVYIGQDGRIYRSKAQAGGQMDLPLDG